MPALLVEILAEGKQFAHELDKAAGKTRQLSKVAGVAGLAIAGGLAIGLEKATKAAIEGQADQARLDTALRITHQSVKEMTPSLEEAEHASRKLGFADNETRLALAKLEVATGSTKLSIKDLAVAEDIARLKKVDLQTATQMLTGSMAGNTRAAKALGIILMPVTKNMDALKAKYKELGVQIPVAEKAQAKLLDKMATGQAAIQQVTDKVRGQAAAYSDTAEGGMAKFHAEIQRLEEVFGNMLIPALETASTKLASLAQFMSDHAETAKILLGVLAGVAAVLLTISAVTAVVSAATAIASAATAVWTAAQWLLNIALTANPIGLVVIAVAALVAGIIIAYKESDTFRQIVAGAFDAVASAATTVLDFFRSHWPEIAVLISGPFAPLVLLATDGFGIRSALVGAFSAVLDAARTLGGQIVGGIVDGVTGVATAVSNRVQAVVDAIGDFFGNMFNKASALGHRILDGIVDGVTGVATAVANRVQAVVDAIGGFFGNMFNKASNLGGRILDGVIDGVTGIVKAVADRVQNVIDAIGGLIAAARAKAFQLGDAVHDGFIAALSGIGRILVRVFKGAINAVIDVWNDFHIPALKVFGHEITPEINFPNIPHLASGGIVTSPTLALIGERGPEAVIPLGSAGIGGGLTVNVSIPNYVGDKRELTDLIVATIVQANRNGTLKFAGGVR
jgi:hypothetical protein